MYADIDFDRVYASDMKKMIKWFAILQANDIVPILTEVAEDAAEENETEA